MTTPITGNPVSNNKNPQPSGDSYNYTMNGQAIINEMNTLKTSGASLSNFFTNVMATDPSYSNSLQSFVYAYISKFNGETNNTTLMNTLASFMKNQALASMGVFPVKSNGTADTSVVNPEWTQIFGSNTVSTLTQNANNAFDSFLKNTNWSSISNGSDFAKALNNFFTPNGQAVTLNDYTNLAQNLFGISENAVPSLFKSFYQNQVSKNGYFSLSKDIGAWEQTLQNKTNYFLPDGGLLGKINLNKPGSVISKLSGSAQQAARNTLVINRVLLLLIEMVDSLQKATAAESKRLGILATWQQHYSDLMAEITPFSSTTGIKEPNGVTLYPYTSYRLADPLVQGTNSAGETYSSSVSTTRGYMNATNTTYTQTVQSKRDQVGSDAKKAQATVSQSQSAANQQISIANSILQELSGLISAIFR